jgi:hypothetical protein
VRAPLRAPTRARTDDASGRGPLGARHRASDPHLPRECVPALGEPVLDMTVDRFSVHIRDHPLRQPHIHHHHSRLVRVFSVYHGGHTLRDAGRFWYARAYTCTCPQPEAWPCRCRSRSKHSSDSSCSCACFHPTFDKARACVTDVGLLGVRRFFVSRIWRRTSSSYPDLAPVLTPLSSQPVQHHPHRRSGTLRSTARTRISDSSRRPSWRSSSHNSVRFSSRPLCAC